MVFVGAGNDKDEIVAYTQSLGLGGKVLFSPAIRDRNRIRAWYCRADLFLFPSTFDTNGLVVREAAACGLGSVLVAGSCAAEDVTDGVSGFLIQENADSMAAKLREILENPEVMRQVGEGAQREIYVSWEEAVSRAYERYFTVINNFRRGMYPERDKFSDDFFRGMANLMDISSRSRKLQQQMVQQFQDQMNADAMSSYDSFMGRMDRFL
jgi:glycosyltransferase involved in cell wall biosynthesis